MWLGCFLLLWASIAPVYAFYNPTTGRWLSRDPIGQPGFQVSERNRYAPVRDENTYIFVGNNPLTSFDLLGLTEKDLTAILDQFKKSMAEMCKKKKRCDCPIGPLKDIHASCSSSVLGCAAQADTMEGDIIALQPKLDDQWLTEHRENLEVWPCFYHQDVKITPLKPQPGGTDGYILDNIVLDTFRGCYYIMRRKLVNMPNPTQSFWLWSYEEKCFKCADFNK